MKRLLLVAVLLTGCATSYKPYGYHFLGSSGFEDRKLGPDKYLIVFIGNAYTSVSTRQDFAVRRAQEVCAYDGFKDFDSIFKLENGDRTELTIKCVNPVK